MLDPSKVIHERYRTMQFVLGSGRVVSGVVLEESTDSYRVATNLLMPEQTLSIRKDDVEERIASQVSAMPAGLLNVLSSEEVLALVSFLEAGDDLPAALRHVSHP